MAEPLTYVALGDSITEGYGVAFGFVECLAERLGTAFSKIRWKVVTSGRSGETSAEALYRIESDVLPHHPFLVTINYGVNDAFSGIPPSRFEKNLEIMMDRIRKGGCEKIVLVSSEVISEPSAERQVIPYWEAMERAAERNNAVYADVNGCWRKALAAGRREEELIIRGDLHPNEEGHKLIAEAVWEALVRHRLLEGV